MCESVVKAHLGNQARCVGYTRDKVPINPVNNELASVSDPLTWATHGEARAWADRTDGHVGFIPLHDYLVIDFDDVVQHGQIHPWVQAQIDAIGAETERSCSGEGVHISVPMDDDLRALLPHKRTIRSDQLPLEKVELIVGYNGVIVGTQQRPATRSVPEQQEAARHFVADLLSLKPSPQRRAKTRMSAPERAALRLHETGEISFDVNLAKAARSHNCDRAYLSYLWMRTLEKGGQGFVLADDVRRELTAAFAARGRKHPKKAAKRLIDQVIEHRFAELKPDRDSGRTVIRFVAPWRIAALLGTELGEMAPMPMDECLSATPRRWVYLGIIRKRDSTAERPRPTSRAARREMTGGTSAVTQRKAEQMANVRVEQNWVVGSPPPGRSWQRLPDGRTAYQISVSTTVHPICDRERLDKRMVQRDDRRVYCYPNLAVTMSAGTLHYRLLGKQPLTSGKLVNLWECVA